MKWSKKIVCTKVVVTLLIVISIIGFILCIFKQPNDNSLLDTLFGGKVLFEDGLGFVVYENRKRSIEISEYRVLYAENDVDVTCKRATYSAGEKKLEYEISNDSELSIIASPAYYLDANIDGKWYQIYVFTIQSVGAKILNKGESAVFSLDTTQTAGYIDDISPEHTRQAFIPVPLPKGLYRIVPIVSFSYGDYNPISEIYPYAYFTIK